MGRRPVVMLATVALGVALAMPATAATASSGLSSKWTTWLQEGLSALAHADGGGPLGPVGPLSAVDRSELSLGDGSQVTVTQRTTMATDGDDSVLVGLTILGGTQEVVDGIDLGAGQVTTLVLDPGTSNVSADDPAPLARQGRRYRHGGNGGAVTGSTDIATMVAPASTAASPSDAATPSVVGGCYASPDAPIVIGSIYGPLVKGIGVVSCPYANVTLAALAALYERSGGSNTAVGTAASASLFGTYLAVDTYAACTPAAVHSFETAQLWSANGVLQTGAASGWSGLDCR